MTQSRDASADPAAVATSPSRPDAAPEGAKGLVRRLLGRRRRFQRGDLLFLAVAAAWIAFDQITKVVLRESLAVGEHWELASFYRFSHVQNEGAAFGLFGDGGVWLDILPAFAVVAIAAYYLFPPASHWLIRLGLALLLGGAIGNWLDRLYQGQVTDFINFSHFPAFNVADVGINLGIAAIVIYLVVSDAKRNAHRR